MNQHSTVQGSASFHGEGRLSVGAMVGPRPIQSIGADIQGRFVVFHSRGHVESVGFAHPAQQVGPPRFCEFVMCLAVELEFQQDRLGDYEERFNDLWVPKFGRPVAVAVYVWNVLRQSGLIDWLVRTFR
jgi:hypothetical protein